MRTGYVLTLMLICLLTPGATAGAAAAATIPPVEDEAKAALESSPRHHEWVYIDVPGSDTKLSAFVAYPERKDKAPVVIVIMEIFGLTDWIRSVADRLAAEGFIAIAPDLLSGKGPKGGGTAEFADRDDAIKAVRGLAAPDVVAMLDATVKYGTTLPAAASRFATVGFCWGGGQSFHYAVAQPSLGAAVVYYGVTPPSDDLAKVKAPVLGLYGEDDARVNTTVGPGAAKMRELKKTFVTHTYTGAGHGFLRAQDGRDGANLAAAKQAWPETVAFLKKYLE